MATVFRLPANVILLVLECAMQKSLSSSTFGTSVGLGAENAKKNSSIVCMFVCGYAIQKHTIKKVAQGVAGFTFFVRSSLLCRAADQSVAQNGSVVTKGRIFHGSRRISTNLANDISLFFMCFNFPGFSAANWEPRRVAAAVSRHVSFLVVWIECFWTVKIIPTAFIRFQNVARLGGTCFSSILLQFSVAVPETFTIDSPGTENQCIV